MRRLQMRRGRQWRQLHAEPVSAAPLSAQVRLTPPPDGLLQDLRSEVEAEAEADAAAA